MINKKIFLYITLIFLAIPAITFAKDITIFDSAGEATAYIDTDHEQNIYLWSGDAVAYFKDGSIYGFNGKHLGWTQNGILYDHDGNAVGFLAGSTTRTTRWEPSKGFKRLAPIKSITEFVPLSKPSFRSQWEAGLKYFLLGGKK